MDIDFYCLDCDVETNTIGEKKLRKISAPALLINLQRYDEANFCYEYSKAKLTNNLKTVFGHIFGEFNEINTSKIGYRRIDIRAILEVLSVIGTSDLLYELSITYEQPSGYSLVSIRELLDFELYLSNWLYFLNNISREFGCLTVVLDW